MVHSTYNRFFPYKILKHSDRLQQIADGEIPYPVIMHIYPTNICNNNCYFCIMKEEQKNRAVLKRETLFNAIRDAYNVGVKLIHFSGGGEPTLHPNFLEAIKYARELGMKVAVSTNGSVFLPEMMKYVNHLRVSLNAGTPETYKRDMRPSMHTFEMVLHNIKRYVELRNENRYTCDIGIGYVLSDTNHKEVYRFCQHSSASNVDFVHIRPAFLPNKDDEIKSIISEAFAQSEKAKIDFPNIDIFSIKDKFDGYWTERSYSKCRSTPLVAVLTATGEFSVCQDVFIKFGDMNESNIKDIWGSEEHKEAMSKIKLDKCPRCVENRINEIIEHMFINDDVRVDLV